MSSTSVAKELERLSSLLPELGMTSPRLSQLSNSLHEALDTIQSALLIVKAPLLDKYWEPFQLALHPSLPIRLRASALDAIQRLAASQLLKGSLPMSQKEPGFSTLLSEVSSQSSSLAAYFGTRRNSSPSMNDFINSWNSFLTAQDTIPSVQHTELLIDEIIQTTCSCFSLSNSSDDPLQLSVIKVFLTLLTSPLVQVHGSSLVKVLQTCLHIHTLSRHPVHVSTAKASLTQIMNVVLAKMERVVAQQEKDKESSAEANSGLPEKESSLTSLEQTESAGSLEEMTIESDVQKVQVQDAIPENSAREKGIGNDEQSHSILDGSTTNNSMDEPNHTEISEAVAEVKVTLDSMQPIESETVESHAPAIVEGVLGHNPYSPDPAFYVSLCQNDVYLTLRFLSSMAISVDGKPGVSDLDAMVTSKINSDQLSPVAIKARLLALEMLLFIFTNAGPFLASSQNPSIILIAKQYICFAISKNAMGTHPDLFELAVSLFLMVLRFYLPSLKHEMGILLNSVLLPILEMDNSSYKQKNVILQGLLKICESPQILVDLFINYDCDFSAASIFERMISTCVKIAQGKNLNLRPPSGLMSLASATGFDSRAEVKSQEQRLRLRTLCVLVAAVTSLVDYTKELAPDIQFLHQLQGVGNKAQIVTDDMMPVILNKRPLEGIKLSSGVETVESKLSPVASDDTATMVEERTSRKQSLKHAIRIFNSKPGKGIRLLAQLDLFDPQNPASIASFFRSMPELSKSAIGEYLGDGDLFNIQVMHSFIDLFDFANTPFMKAIRIFLQSFRLPGEAQKIDRIMEKFADRYVETCPGIIAKADTAYTLAFSIMMLNTDQHSPSIKQRMDKAAFIRMNRGINDEQDLPEEFLGTIFDEIKSDEIVLEDEKSGKISQVTMRLGGRAFNETQRLELYNQEIQVLERKSRQLINSADMSYSQTPFKCVRHPEIARPMFAMICWPIMAAFGLVFESSLSSEEIDITVDKSSRLDADAFDKRNPGIHAPEFSFGLTSHDLHAVDICLKGFSASILLASIFQMETERDALISSLANLTALSHLSSTKPKNVKAIKTLLMIASSLGEYLQSSWIQIFKVVSQLERIQMLEERQPSTLERNASRKSIDSQTGQITIDRLFTNSTKLSANAILQFFKCMCQVSLEEVGLSSTPIPGGPALAAFSQPTHQPRMYLLQKLVETASYNLHRIRYEWTQLWRLLQPHFNAVASHPSLSVAKFAVDSLRQLSMKFLEKEELSNYSSQFEFLNNFEWIMKNSTRIEVRDLILNSMSQMIAARSSNIHSGWKSIFVVLSQVTKNEVNEGLTRFSFKTVETIFNSHFDIIYSSRSFVEYTACLAEFAKMQEGLGVDDIILSSLDLLKQCATELTKRIPPDSLSPASQLSHKRSSSLTSPSIDSFGLLEEEHFHLEWAPLFSAFSKVAINSRSIAIRTKAIDTLHEILQVCGHLFHSKYWKSLHRSVIFPIFEDLKEAGMDRSKRESNNSVWISATRHWVECFTSFFISIMDGTGHEVIDALLKMLVDMMAMNDDMLALCGQICFSQWIQNNYRKVTSSDTWRVIVDHIELAFYVSLPAELVQCQFQSKVEGRDETESIPTCFQAGMGMIDGRLLYERGRQVANRVYPSTITVEQLDFDHTIIKCVTHVEWVQSLGGILLEVIESNDSRALLSLISLPILERLLVYFYESYIIARYFNVYYDLRYAIWKTKGTKNISNLAKQETASLATYIRLLFALYRTEGDIQVKQEYGSFNAVNVSQLVIQETMDLFHRYIESGNDKSRNQRDVSTCAPVVAIVFQELNSMPWWTFANPSNVDDWEPQRNSTFQVLQRQLLTFFKLGIKMMAIGSPEVQLFLQEFLEKMGVEYIRIP